MQHGLCLWYVKTDPSQNQDLSTSLEKPYKELLNALFNFQIRPSELKLWAFKERASNGKNPFAAWAMYAFGMSKLTPPRIKI